MGAKVSSLDDLQGRVRSRDKGTGARNSHRDILRRSSGSPPNRIFPPCFADFFSQREGLHVGHGLWG